MNILALERHNKTIYSFKTKKNLNELDPIIANKKLSRMSGGLAWIIDKHIDESIRITYYNSRITSCEVNLKDNNTITILAI